MNSAIEDIYTLTPMQQGMLFHTLMAPGTGVYVEQLTCRIGKGLDTAIFERALQQLVDRHAILRSVFAWEKLNEPVQVARKTLKIAVNHLDWREQSAEQSAQAFNAFLEEDYLRGVTLNRPPLVRFTLIRLADDDARFVWTSHHILYDGWSFARLMTEFLVIYVALSRGETAQLPNIRPYRDYIAWLKTCDMDAAEAFWRSKVGDFEQPTPLGLERHFSGRDGVEKHVWRFNSDDTDALRSWTRQAGVTMNTLVQGVWAILLGHYSQQTDVLFGATVSGRPAHIDGIDSMVGLFINSLPVRVRIDPDARLVDWLQALQADNAQMRQYEFTPLTQIHRWSSVPAGSPLFRSILVFENYPIDESLQRAGDVLPVSDVQLREQDNYPLTFGASLSTSLEFIVSYNTRYFDAATIERLCAHLECLFSAIRRQPDTRLGALPIISDAERHQVLDQWNATHQPLAEHSTLQQRFEAQVAATPQAVAVVSGEVSLTYAQLNARASQIAEALRSRGVGPESRVGICLERSAQMVAAVYGVWKAGAAYVPLDPRLPKDRLAFMVEDAQPTVVLVQHATAAPFDNRDTLNLDDALLDALTGAPNPPTMATGQNLAYVLYTSGSTGRPKGTQITQRATLNMADAHATLFAGVQAGPLRVAGNASLSFDVSVAELVVLLHGHALVIVPDDVRQSPEALLDFIQAQRVDAIDCPTLQLRYLLEIGGATRLPRYVSVGGDAIDAGLWQAMQALPETQCFNFYGPTECTVDVTVSALHGAGEVPVIGKPQANARIYLLDAHLKPVPAGIAGELYVAGEPLARGYWNQPALTAERFVPNPFAHQPGERLYRSGDLARHLPDGSLEFIGRADDQVKVRGFRIEPGEIETALLAISPVSEAIVLPRETGQGDRQLVAYVAVNPSDEQARYWGQSFDEIYDIAGADDPTFNTVGWNSSYDSVPIPPEEMRDWLDSTLARILALKPRQVLELGCGTGMLLHGVAPHVARYYGTDLSERVVGQLQQTVAAAAYQHCDIQLIQRGAHELDQWHGVAFDTVVINSVAQYFPNLDYLLNVIEGAIALIPDHGHLFFGDMRHFGLFQVFHTSLELHKAQPSTLLSRVRESVARIETMETELLVDPAFFVGLMQRFADIVHVQLMPKAGSADNELTRFRYDVVLRVERAPARGAAPALAPQWQAWDAARSAGEGLAALEAQLAAGDSACLALSGIPDARLEPHVAAHALVQADPAPRSTVADLRAQWADTPRHGLHLTDCLALAARHGYHAQMSPGAGAGGVFHAVFSRDLPTIDWRGLYPCDDLASTVNQPSSKQLLPAIQKHLLRSLRNRLPEYMIPARFVMLDRLPRGISGKVDRRALPSPDAPDAAISHDVGSLTPAEEILAGIWRDILGVSALGASDNFFELGGHSLLATRVVSKVRAAFQADLPIRALFEAPTVRGLAQRIELAQREQAGTHLPRIEPRQHLTPPPLSFAQQRLWFIDRLEGASSLYNMPVAVRLSGQLDLGALQRCLDEIVRRHAALRAHFVDQDGVPQQIIADEMTLPIRLIEVASLQREEREARIGALTEQEARQPFDLARGPLVRAMVIRAGDSEHIALLTLHHVVADGWSMGVLVQELGALYAAFVQGKPSPLPDLPIQYADFSVWQRQWLADGVMQRQLDYWTQALQDAPALLPFPTDRPRSAQRAHRGAHVGWVIEAELTDSVKALGRASHSTLFMVLMAAFDVLLARYAGENDVCVGTAVANRNREETEPLIGLFVNTLVMRTVVEPTAPFSALLKQVRATALQAYAHQDVPFEHVVDAVAPVRSLSHQPLFQIMLLLQNTPDTALSLPGLSLQPLGASGSTAKCDLILNVTESGDELHCDFEYDVDLFDAATLERLARHFQQLLRSIVAAPEAPVRTLACLDSAERAQLTQQWNATDTDWPGSADVISRFEAQARTTPQRVAVVSEQQQLTYRELEARADQVAHRLAALGVGSDQVVGVFTERSVQMMVAVLGVMKTGAAYLPLDPDAGHERLSFILGDARPTCVLTQAALLAALPTCEAALICLEAPSATPLPSTPFQRAQAIAAEGLAYLIYTSGSTGTPKAVQVRQHSLNNLLLSMQQSPGIGADDTLLSVTSLAFDLVVPNLFLPLICGARTVYAPREHTDDPLMLARLMEQHQVTLMQATPATWRMLLDNRWPTLQAPLKVLCGGDALSAELAARLLARVPRVWNMYGPTETTVWSSSAPINDAAMAACVGRPLANTQLFVLDDTGEPLPPGVAGELYIGGAGLARGYLNQPALTAEKFVPNPFASTPGQRLYRTGDLARYRADGNVEHLGRLDNLVKLRGFRVEPGEIESALSALPGIAENVVLARQFGEGDTRLVAYWVADEHVATPDTATLRASLAAQLPDYMVPSYFVELDQLPLTRNGKLDRRVLPLPSVNAAARFVAPHTPLQCALAALWAELLKVDRVGLHDNFFESGGHSLLATRLIAHIRRDLGADLPLRAVFEAPDLDHLAQRIEQAAGAEAQSDPTPITARPRSGAIALSAGQQRLWFLEQLQPGNPAYIIPLAVRLSGALDVPAFAAAINGVIARHEVLRTTFNEHDGEPQQSISVQGEIDLQPVALEHWPLTEREDQARQLIDRAARAPFDLSAGPLLRVQLLRLAAGEHIAVVALHHIVADGWSLGLLMNEVAELYRARLAQRAAELPPLPVQYADFALWQRERLAGGALQDQLDYWSTQLADAPTLLALPTDRPRPAMQGHAGASLDFLVPSSTARALAERGQRHNATLFMTLTAALNVLLARYTGQSDLCIGTPIANRRQAELEPLIGLFINTLVLRTHVDLHAGFDDLLAQVRDTALAAYAHQDLPFEQLVDALQIPRHLSHTPLFQVMLVLQNAPVGDMELPGLRLQPLTADALAAKFDLTLYVTEHTDGLACTLEYRSDLFDAASVERMAQHFVQLLQAITQDADTRLGELPWLDRAEHDQLVLGWNDTAVDYGECAGATLHGRFEACARRTPQAVAVVFEDASLTYAELDQQANRLAHQLLALGVRPDQRVALCVERSLEMMVAVLAVLKAGAAYVPLDPQHPVERLAAVLADARPAAVLTQRHLRERLPQLADTAVVCLDGLALDPPSHTPPAVDIHPRQLAYVIYTSGSTGTPKGVGVDHAGICNRLAWMQAAYPLAASERVLQKTPITFDVSVWELFWPLREGATLVIARPGGHQDVAYLHQLIKDARISTLHFVPPMLEAFLQYPAADPLPDLRQVMCSGEALPLALEQRVFTQLPGVALHNLYGPTEASVDVTAWTCMPGAAIGSVPIGCPIANTRIYLLDDFGQPVPAGVAGELHIAGVGLARCYLNRAALTAEHFVPDPFAATPGQRMYRSGDLARYLADGTLEYLGRLDNQIKLRGLRIEPGDIETALATLPGVREAVVVAHRFGDGDSRLVAYWVVDQALEAEFVRNQLAARLPDYMVPAHFVRMDSMPLTANGKLDRRALPVPDVESVEQAFVAPVTAVQQALANIWAELLKRERVGLHTHFFESGGHSLLATRLLAHIRRDLSVELPLQAIFEAPVLGQLAQRIEQATPRADEAPILAVPRSGSAPLSAGQRRLWFIDQLQPGNPAYIMPLAVRLRGELNLTAFTAALNSVVARHDVLRTTFVLDAGEPRQQIAPHLHLDIPLRALDHLPQTLRDRQVSELIDDAAQASFDLASGPLLRVQLLRLGAVEHVAIVTLHHIVADGWSLGLLMHEVAESYAATLEQREPVLPLLTVQYADFAQWQASRAVDAQPGYWTGQLADAPTLLALPTDRPRPSVQGHRGAALDFTVAPAIAQRLGELGRAHNATLFMTLLAAFDVLLARYAGQSDICVGTPIANRRQAELEPLIGLFINTLVLRTHVDLHAPFEGLLGQVRDTALAAYAHQDVPFEQLVDALDVERHLSHTPLFQVMLVLQNAPVSDMHLPGLDLEPLAADAHATKFDLTLYITEHSGGLACSLEYSTDLFDAATAARISRHFVQLLHGICTDPTQRVGELALLDKDERHALIHDWNATAVDFGNEQTLHARFEQQARLTPDAMAVVADDERLTYAELNSRANQLAHCLRNEHGLGPEQRAAICVERSAAMMIGLIAVLKTGAAYIPFDPSSPVERLAAMLKDATPSVLLTQQHLSAGLPPVPGLPVLLLDAAPAPWQNLPTDNPGIATLPDQLAYVIYTSGSTGLPKGVMIAHGSLMHYLNWAASAYPVQREVGSFMQLPLVFDAAITPLYLPLLAGKAVHLPSADAGAELFAFLKQPHDLSLLKITPAHIELIAVGMARHEVATRIVTTVVGGEALSAAQARTWLEYFPETTLVNEYGPTETTVGCCVQPVRGSVPYDAAVPIGKPIANTRLRILDTLGNPVPIGVAGELHIAGDGLGRGYLNRPGLTAAAFIPDPFGTAPGARMYRSGDLARYLADGTLEYLGRIDNQLKIRGFRIEPGEIEAVIAGLPGIRDVFVSAWHNPADPTGRSTALVAYVVAAADAEGDVTALRSLLRERLPAYMLPTYFIALDRLPLTANGKVDRRALPAPDIQTTADADLTPLNATETALAAIWASVLRLERVGRQDNFFELGGNSLLAVQLVNHAAAQFAVSLPIRVAFEFQTLGSMARYIEEIGLLTSTSSAADTSNSIRI